MKIKKFLFFVLTVFLAASFAFAQRPPRRPVGEPKMPRGEMPPNDDRQAVTTPDFLKSLDSNKNQKVEFGEFQAGAESLFKLLDKNANGTIDENETARNSKMMSSTPIEFPVFLIFEREKSGISHGEFTEKVGRVFRELDKNSDGVLDRIEMDEIRPPFGGGRGGMNSQMSPKARFLRAEMRFGDKLIKDAPFSADIEIENSRRLFNGTTLTKKSEGAIYRDSAGRIRREQTIDDIGGISIGESQRLIFINDFVANVNYFIDINRKTVREKPLNNNRPPHHEFEPKDGKTESLGMKQLEGVNVEGTRTTYEIPVGEIGNDKPIYVITEKWYSPELQMIVMSKHTDPLAGEQIFRLTNIILGEPAAELFTIPKDYKLEK